jgi:hypothetical protein
VGAAPDAELDAATVAFGAAVVPAGVAVPVTALACDTLVPCATAAGAAARATVSDTSQPSAGHQRVRLGTAHLLTQLQSR